MSALKKYIVTISAISIALLGFITPAAKAFDDVDLDIESTTYELGQEGVLAGTPIVIDLEISGCDSAPTTLYVQIFNNDDETTIDKNYSRFNEKVDDNYLATWVYTANGDGLETGEVDVIAFGSGGCLGPDLIELESSYGDVFPTSSVIADDLFAFGYPGDGVIHLVWSKAIGATGYEVWYGEDINGSEMVKAGETTQTTFDLVVGEHIEISKLYKARITPIANGVYSDGGFAGDNWATDNRAGVARTWTSLAGDQSANEVSRFDVDDEIQFNMEIGDCTNTSGLLDGSAVFVSLDPSTFLGGYEPIEGFEYQDGENLTNDAFHKNLQITQEGQKVILKWQSVKDMPAGSYVVKARFGDGCPTERGSYPFGWPLSEYFAFEVTENGKGLPRVREMNAARKLTANSIELTWTAPSNSEDGPFTYRIFETGYSDNPADWKLLKKTTQRKFVLSGLNPETYKRFAIKVSNSAGSKNYFMDAMTENWTSKIGRSYTKAQLAKLLAIPKASQAKFKFSLRNFSLADNECSIKKGKLVFSKSVGVCGIKATWKVAGKSKSKTFLALSHK